MDALRKPVEAALEDDVEGEREIAPGDQFEKLQDSAVKGAHRAIGRYQSEVGLKKRKQIEQAEREAANRDPHREKREPRRAMKQPVEELQQHHCPHNFPA
jgi:hypothetical protein